jgi:hypothetical protein
VSDRTVALSNVNQNITSGERNGEVENELNLLLLQPPSFPKKDPGYEVAVVIGKYE